MKQDFLVNVQCMTFNQSQYVCDTLHGFCMQETSFPYVCTIIDDASTDGEPDILYGFFCDNFILDDSDVYWGEENSDYKMYFAQHKINKNCFFAIYLLKYNHYSNPDTQKRKLKYIHQFEQKAKYIAFCEGDDYWIDSRKLEKQVDFLEKHPDYSAVYTNFNSYSIKKQQWRPSDLKRTETGYLYEGILAWQIGIWLLTVCCRREYYESVPVVNDNNIFTGDRFIFMHLATCGKIKYLDDITAVYRYLPLSASHFRDKRQASKMQMNVAKCHLYWLYNGPEVPNKFYKRMEKKYQTQCLSYCFVYKDWDLFKTVNIPFSPITNYRYLGAYLLYKICRIKPVFYMVSSLMNR